MDELVHWDMSVCLRRCQDHVKPFLKGLLKLSWGHSGKRLTVLKQHRTLKFNLIIKFLIGF